jgi:hypothetical protein
MVEIVIICHVFGVIAAGIIQRGDPLERRDTPGSALCVHKLENAGLVLAIDHRNEAATTTCEIQPGFRRGDESGLTYLWWRRYVRCGSRRLERSNRKDQHRKQAKTH